MLCLSVPSDDELDDESDAVWECFSHAVWDDIRGICLRVGSLFGTSDSCVEVRKFCVFRCGCAWTVMSIHVYRSESDLSVMCEHIRLLAESAWGCCVAGGGMSTGLEGLRAEFRLALFGCGSDLCWGEVRFVESRQAARVRRAWQDRVFCAIDLARCLWRCA